MAIIRCKKHGKVEGPFCVICRVERSLEKARLKNTTLKLPPENNKRVKKDLSPLQIRFRAFRVRKYRITKDSSDRWRTQIRGIDTYTFGSIDGRVQGS